MSAFVFVIEPENVYLATDTLSLSAVSKAPFLFTTKMYFLPHLGIVMVGTGLANVVSEWFLTLNSQLLARDMDHVDQFAPRMLAEHFQRVTARFEGDLGSLTIYHFGFSARVGQMASYVYRSDTGFKSEFRQGGMGLKPAPDSGRAEFEIQSVPEDLVSAVGSLMAEDRRRPSESRVGIGGEVLYCWLKKDQCLISTVHRFEDWEELFEGMCRRLPRT